MGLTIEIPTQAIQDAARSAVADLLPAGLTKAVDHVAVFDEIKDWIGKAQSPWVDRLGAAAYISCSVATVDGLVRTGKLKAYWLGSSPRFKKSDIDALVESAERPSPEHRRGPKPSFSRNIVPKSRFSQQPINSVPA